MKREPALPAVSLLRLRFARSPLVPIALLALATGIVGVVYLRHQSGQFRQAAQGTLSSIAELKTAEVSKWYAACLSEAESINRNPVVMARVRQFLSALPGSDDAEDVQTWMESECALHHVCQFVIYDLQGRPRLHAPDPKAGSEVPTAADYPEFRAALQSTAVHATDLHPSFTHPGRFSLEFWIPISSKPGETGPTLAVILLEIDPDESLFPLIQSWPVASRTAETLLCRREDDDVVFLNRLRHRENTPLAFRLAIYSHVCTPATMAALGQRGIVSGPDYRGVHVLAAVNPIPGTPWFMVAKEDLSEIDAPLKSRALEAGLTFLFLFATAVMGVKQLWRRHENVLLRQCLATERAGAERFRTLVESLPQLVWTGRTDGQCDYLSPQWVDYTGISHQRRIDDEWVEPFHPEDRPLVLHGWQEAVGCGRSFDMQVRIRRADGVYRWFQTRAVPLRDAAGQVIKWFGTNTDIDTQVEAQEALKRTAEVLSQSNEEVRQFASLVSHDLRSPLVNFRGFVSELRLSINELDALVQPVVQQLGESGQESADRIIRRDVPEALGYIDSSVLRMDHMINSLLRLSRLGHHELVPERLDLGSMVSDILASLATQIGVQNTAVSVAPLPEVTADRASLEQVLSNILGNAVMYLDPARSGRIEVSGELAGTSLVVKVSDNGRGIAESDREMVFAPFRRVGVCDKPGEGMGLAYVRALVRRLDGRIWFDSEPGVGTTFSFILPVN